MSSRVVWGEWFRQSRLRLECTFFLFVLPSPIVSSPPTSDPAMDEGQIEGST